MPPRRVPDMQIAIRDETALACGHTSLGEALNDLGITAVELQVDRGSGIRRLQHGDRVVVNDISGIEALSQEYEAAGIAISALLMGNDFNAPDLPSELAWMTDTVHAAKRLGADAVRVDAIMSGQNDASLETLVEQASEGIREVLKATADVHVRLGIENHGARGNDPEFLRGVLEAVTSARVGLTIDTANFYWWGLPLSEVDALLVELAPSCVHTHIKNIAYPKGEREKRREIGWAYGQYCSPIPDGDLDLAAFVAALKASGFQGDLCIEDESLGRYSQEDRRSNLRRAVLYLADFI